MNKIGVLSYQGNYVVVGVRWMGLRLRIVPAGALIHVFHGSELVRSVALTPGSDFYPLGMRKHGRRGAAS